VAEPYLLLVEWPERAGAALPPPDLTVQLAHSGDVRDATLSASSTRGLEWLGQLSG
jgi:tRNA threonylcarbamoyladenosine biosynthesis protein TsaE